MRRKTFLLTCWWEQDNYANKGSWRFNLEAPNEKKPRLFVRLQDVMEVIEKELKLDVADDR